MLKCSAEAIFKEPEKALNYSWTPVGYAINRGGLYGFDTKRLVYLTAPDPLKVPGCEMCLVKWLDSSPVAIRYLTRDIVMFNDIPEDEANKIKKRWGLPLSGQ